MLKIQLEWLGYPRNAELRQDGPKRVELRYLPRQGDYIEIDGVEYEVAHIIHVPGKPVRVQMKYPV